MEGLGEGGGEGGADGVADAAVLGSGVSGDWRVGEGWRERYGACDDGDDGPGHCGGLVVEDGV